MCGVQFPPPSCVSFAASLEKTRMLRSYMAANAFTCVSNHSAENVWKWTRSIQSYCAKLLVCTCCVKDCMRKDRLRQFTQLAS